MRQTKIGCSIALLVWTGAACAQTRIIELVKTRIPRRFGLNSIRDIQVLCPTNRGAAGARTLNIESTR
jgi:hypothetical protein